MSHRPPPYNVPLSDALQRSEPLTGLLARLAESRARFEAIGAVLPAGLRTTVRPGPIDDEGWALLADHGAAAAKLRQLLPRLDMVLRAKGWKPTPIKVRIQPRT